MERGFESNASNEVCDLKILGLVFSLSLTLCAATQTPSSFSPQTNCSYDLSAVTQAFTNTLAQNGIANGLQLILKDGQKLHEQFAGNYQPNTLCAIASASKWLSTAVILSLMDDGLLSLDDPAAEFFPQLYTGQNGTITFRQMFSHTPGLPGDESSGVLTHDDINLQ